MFFRVWEPVNQVVVADGAHLLDWHQGVEPFVISRAVHIDSQRLAISREGVAVPADGQACHHRPALPLVHVAKLPLDLGERGVGQRFDHPALLAFRRWRDQRNVPEEQGSSDRIFRGLNRDPRLRKRLLVFLVGESAYDYGRGSAYRRFLDLFPHARIGPPGVGRDLFGRQGGWDVAFEALVERPELKLLSIGPNLDRLDAIAKQDVDAPHRRCGLVVAPCELRWNQVRGIEGPVRGNVNVQARFCAVHRSGPQLLRNDSRVCDLCLRRGGLACHGSHNDAGQAG